jgi:hypothetical protein
VIGVKEAKHFAFFYDHGAALSHRRRGRDPYRLTGQAGFPQKIARPQNGNDRLFARGGGCGKLYATRLNVKDIINWLTLGEEGLPLTEFDLSLRYAAGTKKAKYVGGSSTFDFRASGFELRASRFGASSFDS